MRDLRAFKAPLLSLFRFADGDLTSSALLRFADGDFASSALLRLAEGDFTSSASCACAAWLKSLDCCSNLALSSSDSFFHRFSRISATCFG